MKTRTKRNGFRLGILMLCTVMLLFAVMPTGVLADEDVKHNVTFNVIKVDGRTTDYYTATVIDSQSQKYKAIDDEYGYPTNVYALPDGEYSYSITYGSSGGEQNASGTFTVKGEDMTVNIQLETTYYQIRFSVTPENASVELYKNGQSGAYGDAIQPDENGVYNIPFGFYRYSVSADGYVTESKKFNTTDTDLKNNNYVITVNLMDLTGKTLKEA